MSNRITTRGSVADDGAALEPALFLCFAQRGQHRTERVPVSGDGLILGRSTAVFESSFADLRMSPRHAEIRAEGARLFIRDLNSGTGTRVNGEFLAGESVLSPGDVLRLGDTLLVYAPSAGNVENSESELIGNSASMVAVRRSISAVAKRRHTVVITGETGTGKEVVAQLLHQLSGRTGPFIAANCGSFTEGLLASDLFGHVRGAFTGAIAEQQGLFRAAHGGSLLLDEVAEIPLALQANLLRVLEMREVRPVGGTRNIATDVRVFATCNRELIDLVNIATFRPDLYSRLAQWTIRLPPLRERREDIPALTEHLLARCDGVGRKLTPDFAEALLLHDWPLNVRGLFNVLSIAVVSSPEAGPLLLGSEVALALQNTRGLGARAEKAAPLFDEPALIELMQRFRGKVAAAARHIGVQRPKLYRMLWAHSVDPKQFRAN